MGPAELVERLARTTIGSTFNFYRDGSRAALLRERLRDYLAARWDAPVLLVGEAAGYRGARVSGLPFTSERQLTGAAPGEATATIVHAALLELQAADEVLLWNVVPTHPHAGGNPRSNRRPTAGEARAARPFLDAVVGGRRVVPVGRLAAAELGVAGIRHPAHGGAVAFRAGLAAALLDA